MMSKKTGSRKDAAPFLFRRKVLRNLLRRFFCKFPVWIFLRKEGNRGTHKTRRKAASVNARQYAPYPPIRRATRNATAAAVLPIRQV